MQEVFECIFRNGLIPVLTVSDLTEVETYGRFFSMAGFGCLEVTLRTPEALEAIRTLKKTFPALTVGAGTVLNVEEGKKALEAGCGFLVSPGFTVDLLEFCSRNSIPYIPGVQTPVEIQTALGYGFNVLKFFPCEAAGGIRTLKALGAPFYSVGFVPTGGINKENMRTYLALGQVFALGGSFVVPSETEIRENFGENLLEASSLRKAVNSFFIEQIKVADKDFFYKSTAESGFAGIAGIMEALELGRESFEECFRSRGSVTPGFSNSAKGMEVKGEITISCLNLERAGAVLKKAGFGVSKEKESGGKGFYLEILCPGWVFRITRKTNGDYHYQKV